MLFLHLFRIRPVHGYAVDIYLGGVSVFAPFTDTPSTYTSAAYITSANLLLALLSGQV